MESTYYVGVGASAGGLEALQRFFSAMPIDTGMAFVVIQHLSPDYKSLMDELLARHTSMPIRVATDGMVVKANNIYLIPSKNNLVIYEGKLFLEEQKGHKEKRLNLPIDIFFRSLAKDKANKAISIILSGTGSDGTLGIRAIKEAGGMVMVQDDKSAKFDGMPRSSISTGLVDYILPPEQMAEELINYTKHPFIQKETALENIMSENTTTLAKIIYILREFSGTDFSYYKENTIIRRLERRVSINRLDTLEEYMKVLSDSDKEKEIFYRELLIGVTSFFRDKEAFDIIKNQVLPELSCGKKSIRIWSAACSTGEEVYSLAMLLAEHISNHNITCEVKIFATDIDRHSLDVASKGYYTDSIMADVEPHLLSKYFTRMDNGYQVKEIIRKMVVFATHNILKDSPFSKLDLIVCRNLFIYLKPDMQQKLLSMFYFSLSPTGFLFMGSSESMGEMSEAFDTVDSKWKIYKYKQGYKRPLICDLPISNRNISAMDPINTQNQRLHNGVKMDKVLESAMAAIFPPTIILDTNDNIIQVINNVNPYLNIRPGAFSQNIFSNLSTELALFVGNILRRLKSDSQTIIFDNISGLPGFDDQKITIEGRALNTERNYFYMLSFNKSESKEPAPEKKGDMTFDIEMVVSTRVGELERELQVTRENLHATVEELETSNEELQSSNEELIASNEELQSTNEELQSVNEELYSVNSEFQTKITELTQLTNDLRNLLRNTEVGALYLDRDLCIRKITNVVSQITNILPSDVGRPISHIAAMRFYTEMIDDINTVVENLTSVDKEVKDQNGKIWFTRIRPYRTEHNTVDGMMITFVDISKLKVEEQRNVETNAKLNQVLEMGNMAWWELAVGTGQVIYSDRMASMLGYDSEEFPDDIYQIGELIHPDDYVYTMQSRLDYLEGNIQEWEVTYRIKRKDGTYAWYFDSGIVSELNSQGFPLKMIGTVIDVSKLKDQGVIPRKEVVAYESKE